MLQNKRLYKKSIVIILTIRKIKKKKNTLEPILSQNNLRDLNKLYIFVVKKKCDMNSQGLSNKTLKTIPILRDCLKSQPIKKAWLFGSYARGEETDESDVDLMVRYDRSEAITLFTIARISIALSKAIGREVDLVEEGRLIPSAEKSANKDKILIYERES